MTATPFSWELMASSNPFVVLKKGGFLPPFFLLFALLGIQANVIAAERQSSANRNEAALEQSAASTRPDYKIGVGDLIRIQVHGEEDLTLETRIDSKGTVTYPFLVELKVAGKTVRELETQITNGLKPDYLISPEVQVLVVEYRPFFVNGQVKRPGGYPYIPDLTIQKAIALAGGLTELASTNKIFLIREQDTSGQRTKVSLESAVMPGDTVIVEEGLF